MVRTKYGNLGVSEDVLCAGNDETLKFIEDVLGEIIQIFPSEYIHVGGDECPKVRWAKCPKCQARIKALGLKSDKNHTAEERLQSFIINHAEKFLNGHGRQIIGWDEILEGGLAPNATVMSWRGVAGGIEAAKQKHDVIMTPNTYCISTITKPRILLMNLRLLVDMYPLKRYITMSRCRLI